MKSKHLEGVTSYLLFGPNKIQDRNINHSNNLFIYSHSALRSFVISLFVNLVSCSHGFNGDSDFPDATVGDAGNKCRNPRRDEVILWCYTTDNNTRWDFCDVPLCPGGKIWSSAIFVLFPGLHK